MNVPDTLGLEEAAAALRIAPSTLRKRAAAGKVPGYKPGRQWIFISREIGSYSRGLRLVAFLKKRASVKRDAFRAARRKAELLKRTPAWADQKAIRSIYDECERLNAVEGWRKYHVDHEIPLQGHAVSGLHVHENLRVLTAIENRQKWNKHL